MSTSSPSSVREPPPRVRTAAAFLLLLGVIAYANSWRAPFVFDDVPSIVENPSIRHLWPLTRVLAPDQSGGITTSGRPIVNLSLALNHAVSGERVWSYHALNLATHLLAGLCLFGIVRRTLLCPALSPRFGAEANGLAAIIAAIWVVHPLQTESITYVIQRAESLVGLFYLLTLYAFIRGTSTRAMLPPPVSVSPHGAGLASPGIAETRPPEARHVLRDISQGNWSGKRHAIRDVPDGRAGWFGWLGLGVIACALGMATKEVMVSAPILILLYDRTFVAGSFLAAWRRRRGFYLALAASWLLLAALVISTRGRGGTAGFASSLSAWTYALTQCRAIVRYLALSVWPHPLIFDYGLVTERNLGDVLPQALLVVGLLAATAWAVARRPVLGFCGVWFFAVLAPSSSFVPVVTQTMAEHRMYLPLAAVAALLVIGTHAAWGSRSRSAWIAAILALGGATIARNHDYRSDAAIWADTVTKLPTNARAHNNLGQAQFRLGRLDDAMASYDRALALQPSYPETHYNMGVALARRGDLAAAIGHYEIALRLQPDYPEAHNNLANALVRAGRMPDALAHYEQALRLRPEFAEAQNNLGNALLQAGRVADAIARFERALQLKPGYAEAYYNLGNAFAAENQMARALAHYRRALEFQPGYAEAHVNAGNALLELGRRSEAIAEYAKAVALNPTLVDALYNWGSVLLQAEQWNEAISRFEAALRVKPDSANAHRALGFAFAHVGRTADAIAHYEACLRVNPGDAEARAELAELRGR